MSHLTFNYKFLTYCLSRNKQWII